MTVDMTQGSPAKILWKFCLPLLISIIFQQLYTIMDSVLAGQFISENALAAVGASYPITMIFMAVASGSNIGCSVIISQLFGAKDITRMKSAISTALISIGGVSILLTAIGFVICNPLMHLLGTPENIFADSALFLQIYIAGLIFLFYYNICTGIFTALGDSRTPLYFLIASSLANIAVALLFILVFKMGVAGLALATFLCQGLAAVCSLITLLRRIKKFKVDETYQRFSTYMLGRISRIAIPSILQASFVSVGNLFIQGLINSYGSAVIAAYSAAIKLNTFALMGFSTFASGVSTFTAQNMGAGKVERVRHGLRAGGAMALAIAVPFFVANFIFSEQSMHLFLNTNSVNVVEIGEKFLRITSPFYFIIMLKLICDALLRGAGCVREFMITTFSDLILRVMLSYLFAGIWGVTGIWMSWPVGWTVGTLLSLTFYFRGKWKTVNVLHAD